MKRRIGGCLMSLLLIATFLVPLLEVRPLAADNVYFISVNDNLCPMNDETMPFWSGGDLYVPHTVFSSYDLGITYFKTNGSQSALLYTRGKILEFDLVNGGANNKVGTYYTANALLKQGYTYFPLAFVSNYFGLKHSVINTDLVPVVRICSDSVVLSDSRFVDAASTLMAARYSSYQQSKKPPVISKPDAMQPSQEGEVKGETANAKKNVHVTLGIRAQNPETVGRMLDTLDFYGYKATFFFEPEGLGSYEDFLRRIVASGHRIGFASGSSSTALKNGNKILRHCTGTVTRMTLSNNTAELSQAGYGTYTPALSENSMGETQSVRANRMLSRLEKSKGSVRVLMCGDPVSADVLSVLCSRIHDENYSVHAVNEVDCQ